ncbi:uncharacterized protein LOC105663558 [Megachile rotundata]|uniref:uncharacterized protein LOC105663558 n=1 Tax=Megachile rotundata TaxID=143995 RepID=UPI000614E84F|nr:PREDICTED: uncharacterized protein LOC105663558 [Megachile rotundata]
MLGMILRGVFLIGILTWYSTSVWKMIDGYFRDQFRSYLEEEYKKNPRMKTDVQGNLADKTIPVVTTPQPETTVAPQREIEEANHVDTCAVEVAENDSALVNENVTGGTSENETAVGFIDKNAFLGTATEALVESRKWSENEQESRQLINYKDRDLKQLENRDDHQSVSQMSESPRKRIKYDRKPTIPRNIPKKRKVKTIILTEKDFKSVRKNRRVSDDDFWEFDEDADKKESVEGILVSELPFKPRLDIRDLERVTADEYCPLTLEDETSCDETFKWP